MSVFRRAGRATYDYSFKFKGRKYYKSTKATTEAEARAIEAAALDVVRRERADYVDAKGVRYCAADVDDLINRLNDAIKQVDDLRAENRRLRRRVRQLRM